MCRSRKRARDALLFLLWSGSTTKVVLSFVNHNLASTHPSVSKDKYESSVLVRSSRSDNRAVEAEAKAGRDGYSVLRQPARWDMDEDPEFEAPSTLREDDENTFGRLEDSLWWSGNKVKPAKGGKLDDEKVREKKVAASSVPSIARDEDLDLYQRSLDTLDFTKILRSLFKECTTVPARNLVEDATHFHLLEKKGSKKFPRKYQEAFLPLVADNVEGVQQRYKAVQEMQWILSGSDGKGRQLYDHSYRNRKGIKESIAGRGPPFRGLSFNLESLLQIADQGKVLEGPEILEVSSMMDAFEDVILWSQALEKVDDGETYFEVLPDLARSITVNATLQDLLHNAFDKNGRLSGTTFPVLGRLRDRVRVLKADIMRTLDRIVAMPSMQSKLALESGGSMVSEVNGGRLVIPVAAKYASSVGIVHDTSRSEKTVYCEPTEIVGPTNELRQAESELRQEEARVWRSLTEQILNNRLELEAAVSAVGQLDLVVARLRLGQKLEGIIPQVEDEGVINLKNARHPVLILREIENVVGSDISLGMDGNQGLVLTGPNAGGKTVILKLLGLMALMSRSGVPLPAAQRETNLETDKAEERYIPRVDFFDPVLADIGDLQSVGGDLSTFSGHMLVCREVLSKTGKNALVLMDELGSGTDPNQGVAIAQAIMETLLETGARVVITTHYLQLKNLAASDDRFAVAGMQFVNGRPTYKLLPGTVGESFALAVAERLELPAKVIDRANELLDSETRQMGDLIRELEDQRALVESQARDLEEKKKEMAALELKIKEEQMRLEKKQLTARRDEAKKFAKKLEEKGQILEDILEKLRKDPSRRILAKSWDDIKFVKRDALTEAENIPSVLARKKKAERAMEDAQEELVPLAEMREKPDLQEGDKLIVCQPGALFGREATVVNFQRNRVTAQVSGSTMGLKLKDVALPPSNGRTFQSFQTSGSRNRRGKSPISKATEKALQDEMTRSGEQSTSRNQSKSDSKADSKVTIRTDSNTVDVRGCNLEEAKSKAKEKFSTCLMMGRPVVYILHGHGTGGVLKTKIRNWLKTERQIVTKYAPADEADGGDAFTRVELR